MYIEELYSSDHFVAGDKGGQRTSVERYGKFAENLSNSKVHVTPDVQRKTRSMSTLHYFEDSG